MIDDYEDDPAAIMGYSSKASTLADGTLRLQIDIPPKDAQLAFRMFGTPHSPVGMARLTDEIAVETDRPKLNEKGEFGKYARALVLSGFFKEPKIWECLGSDEDYCKWLRNQKSACSGEQDHDPDTGELFCVPAHYRRVERGSGTAIKPKFSAIPLTNMEHQTQHNHGHNEIGPDEWWEGQCLKYASQWAYETLKKRLNYDSYTDIAPHRIVSWCEQRALEDYLPAMFRDPKVQNGESTESTPEGES